MVVVTNVKAPEQFLHNINGDYSMLFDVIEVEANTALPEGTVLEYATGDGEPIPVVLQDTEAVFGIKQRTVTDYDNVITAAVEAKPAVYGTQTIKVIDGEVYETFVIAPPERGGWKIKDPASTSTKLGVLVEYVKASPEAQKVKVAVRSNAFNAAI